MHSSHFSKNILAYYHSEPRRPKEADARSDIFDLGAVLYEMASGKRAFAGKRQASIVAAILASDPQPISAVQPMSPLALDRVVRTCLAKDPDERWQTAHDLKLQLGWIAEGGSEVVSAAPSIGARGRPELWAWGVASIALVVATAIGFLYWHMPRSQRLSTRASILPPERATFTFLGANGSPALAPDGRNVAFVARTERGTQVWVLPLDSYSARPLSGTENATQVFWSPDSRHCRQLR